MDMRGTPMGSSVLENSQPINDSAEGQTRRAPLESSTTTQEPKSDAPDTTTDQAPAEEQQSGNDGTAQGDAGRDKPLSITDVSNDIPTFFILDNRPNTGDKLAPPVGLHDPD